jgi:hypothetical protein
MSQRLKAIHPWKADIEQNEIRGVTAGEGKGILGIGGGTCAVTGLVELKTKAPPK